MNKSKVILSLWGLVSLIGAGTATTLLLSVPVQGQTGLVSEAPLKKAPVNQVSLHESWIEILPAGEPNAVKPNAEGSTPANTTTLPPREAAERTVGLLNAPVRYKVVKQDVRDILQELARLGNIRLEAGSTVSGLVQNVTLSGTLRESLDNLSQRAQLIWWWDGTGVRVTSAKDITIKVLQMGDPEKFETILNELGFPLGALMIEASNTTGLVRLSGPASVVAEAEAIARSLKPNQILGRTGVTIIKFGRISRENAPIDSAKP